MKLILKTSKFIFGLTFIAMAIVSCSDENVQDTNSAIFIDPEAYIRKKTKEWESKGISDNFETYSLEEINRVMRENGLEEISLQEVEAAKKLQQLESRSCAWPCATWHALGDNTGDGVLNVSDLVELRRELCRLGTGIGNCYDGYSNLMTCSNQGCPKPNLVNNCILSYLVHGNGFYELGAADHIAMQQRILGIICCN